MGVTIHKTAIVENGAEIGDGSEIGAYSVIGPKVKLGKNCKVCPHVVIEGNTKAGDGNFFFQFASVGAIPQDLKYKGEDSELIIGSGNIVREYVTLQPGTEGGGMKTTIGSKNLFMACSHVGHDNVIGSNNIIANGAAVAGHVVIGNKITIGGLVGIHQFVRIGDYAMIGAGAMVAKDVPPFCIAQGDRAGLVGVNKIGLERAGFKSEEIQQIQSVYRKLFYEKGSITEQVKKILENNQNISDSVKQLLDFISESQRGVITTRKRTANDG